MQEVLSVTEIVFGIAVPILTGAMGYGLGRALDIRLKERLERRVGHLERALAEAKGE